MQKSLTKGIMQATKKKIALFTAMLMTVMSVGMFVCVDEVYATSDTFRSFQEDINNCEPGGTVTLSYPCNHNANDDINFIQVYKDITIDLDDNTVDRQLFGHDFAEEGYVFQIAENANVTIKNGKITGGNNISGGGAIRVEDGGKLTLENVVFINNGTGVKGNGQDGGAIYCGYGTELIADKCLFTGNSCMRSGGAASGYSAKMTFTDCTFDNNKAAASGGAISASDGCEVKVDNCYFESNKVKYADDYAYGNGGAISVFGEKIKCTVNNCQFKDNIGSSGGALFAQAADEVSVNNCKFEGNTATEYASGAAICSSVSKLTLSDVSVTGNKCDRGAVVFNNSMSSNVNTNILKGKIEINGNTKVSSEEESGIILGDKQVLDVSELSADSKIAVSEVMFSEKKGAIVFSGDLPKDFNKDSVYSVNSKYIVKVEDNKLVWAEPSGGKSYFDDVKDTDYFAKAANWAAEKGIAKGTADRIFSPALPTTRAEVVTFLWRADGSPEPKGDASKFKDVEKGSFYEKAVAWAIEKKVTKGTSETTFSPSKKCSRAEIITLVARFAGVNDTDTKTTFEDVKSTDYFAAAVKWAKEKGITTGTSETKFSPKNNCSRAEAVTFLYRLLNEQ